MAATRIFMVLSSFYSRTIQNNTQGDDIDGNKDSDNGSQGLDPRE